MIIKLKKEKLVLMNFKVTTDEKKLIVKLAKKHAAGNISRWIRFTSTRSPK